MLETMPHRPRRLTAKTYRQHSSLCRTITHSLGAGERLKTAMGLERSRSAQFASYADEPDVHILVSGSQQPLLAHYHVLRHFSICVRDLPRNDDSDPLVWDLRQLVLEGGSGPVPTEIVQRWLDLVYSRVDFARRVGRIDLDDARPLLLFADACGTTLTVINDIGHRLLDNPDLSLGVTVGEGEGQVVVRLRTRGATYSTAQGGALMKFENHLTTHFISAEDFAPHASAFPSAVCSALESWLHLAGRLGMVLLCRALLDFVKAQLVASNASILLPAYNRIFSRRVLQCMPRELLYEALVRDSLVDRPAEVGLEGEGVKVMINSRLAAEWFAKPVGTTESITLVGGSPSSVRDADGNFLRLNVVLGGVGRSTASRMVEEVMEKVGEESSLSLH